MSRSLLIFRDSTIPYPGTNVWRAAINSDVDGDTTRVERDTGCRHPQLIEIRITGDNWKGFNADERFTIGGRIVSAEVKRLIPDWTVVRIETQPDTEKYGRWLSPILIPFEYLKKNFPGEAFRPSVMVTKQDPGDVVRGYVDLAAYLVDKYPSYAHWQDYK